MQRDEKDKAAKIRFEKIIANLIRPTGALERPETVVAAAPRPPPVKTKRILTKYEQEQRDIRRARKMKGLYAL